MDNLIDGQIISSRLHEQTRERVTVLKKKGISPILAVLLVGDDKPSATYVRKKGEAAKSIGLGFELHTLPGDIKQGVLLQKIHAIQENTDVCGLIVQLPLPAHLDSHRIINSVRADIDVDCLTDVNIGKLCMGTALVEPPTPGAVMSILEHIGVNLTGKNVTIIGAGKLVGKPLAMMMINAHASVTICNSATKDIKEKCLHADIIVTGVGKRNILRGDMVSSGAIVIDSGVSFEQKKMYGDVNMDEVKEKAAWLTPTPGGVGPITVARLLFNTVLCAEYKIQNL